MTFSFCCPLFFLNFSMDAHPSVVEGNAKKLLTETSVRAVMDSFMTRPDDGVSTAK